MKKFILLFILISSITGIFAVLNAQQAGTGRITVNMTGFKNDTGNAQIALVNSKQGFDSESVEPFMGARTKISGGEASYTFNNVPYGEYAVKFFHDENGSGKLETGSFGIPKEEYGLSNNIRSKNYNKAKFELSSPNLILNIQAK